MSSTTDASNAISFNGVGTSSISNEINSGGAKDYSQGLQSPTDFYKFLQIVDKSSIDFFLSHMDSFLNTTDEQILDATGKSRFVARKIRESIDHVIDPWQSDAIKQILMVLKHIPFDLAVLIDNELGFALKSIKKAAIAKSDSDVLRESTSLIKDWKVLQESAPTNENGKRNSPERSSSSPPPTPPSDAKKFKLAIQKEPPAKPKALIDPNFLSALVEPKPLMESKKFRITRPIYNVDKLDTDSEEVGSPIAATSTGLISMMKGSAATAPKRSPPLLSSPVNRSPPSKRRRVTFKDDLCEYKYYEKDPLEWSSFDTPQDDIENYYPDIRSTRQQQQQYQQQQQPPVYYNIPSMKWSQPLELNFNTDENPNLVIPKLIRTQESFAQDNREKLALAAIYTSIYHIPASPAEPDEAANPNVDTRVIPLEDVNAQPTYNNTPSSAAPAAPAAPAAALNPNLFTSATLDLIAAAIKDPSVLNQQQIQQAQQPIYHQPAPPAVIHHQQQINNNNNYNHHIAPQQQTELSNGAVEAVLKNNPGIMQSLKQLSFLAAGSAGNEMNNAPQMTNNYQAPPPVQNSFNHNEPYRNNDNNNSNNTKKRFKNGGRGGRGRGGGARGGRGGKAPRLCTFYNTPGGCRKGNSCPWPHVNEN